jgi:hypothetical protein
MQITATGGNLYQIAMVYLNDATQWNRIVQANLNPAGGPPLDPSLTGINTLSIPAVNSNLTGGILDL